MKYVIEITNKTFVLSVDKNLVLAFGSFSDCPNSGSMILGAQLVHINEGKLALFRMKDNVLLTHPPAPPQIIYFYFSCTTSTPYRPFVDPTSSPHSEFFSTQLREQQRHTTTTTTFSIVFLHNHHHHHISIFSFTTTATSFVFTPPIIFLILLPDRLFEFGFFGLNLTFLATVWPV